MALNTKWRWTLLGVAVGVALALPVGFAVVSGASAPAGGDLGGTVALAQNGGWASMEAMHNSPGMQRMHARMPEQLRAQCEAMHEQMGQMMDGAGMTSGDMSAHHQGTTGGGMMGEGAGSSEAMMGAGSES